MADGVFKKKIIMKEKIIQILKEISEKEKIKILFANESGSRAWGFPSPDSDFDVRFIYVRPYSYYLSIANKADHLNYPISNELDIYGWDLRKVLQLILKSNTTPFEWLQSPIVYCEEVGFKDSLFHVCLQYFSARKNALHYLGIAKGALDTMVSADEIKVKKLFYVLRPLLAATWSLEKGTIAPMTIEELMELMPVAMQSHVKQLILEKVSQVEGFIVKIDPFLKTYIEQTFISCEKDAEVLPKAQFEHELLDRFFVKILKEYDF